MKTIGLIGGMSWESSLEYYRIINETVKELLGGYHSAKCIMYSFDFELVQSLQKKGEWDELTLQIIDAAQKLENAGVELIILCTNTVHKIAHKLQNNINIPLLHIADPTAKIIIEQEIRKVGLLGTKFTMEEEFYKSRLIEKYRLEVLVPEEEERQVVHNIIFEELVLGIINPSSKVKYKTIIQSLRSKGAEGIILGCTEIPLLIKQEDIDIPLFDTTAIHARAAVDFALSS
jgi:aspartate racemase